MGTGRGARAWRLVPPPLGRVRASCSPALRPVRGVLPLDWDRRPRVTPAETASQEAWPGPEPLGPAVPQAASRKWSAGKSARSQERVAASEKDAVRRTGLAGVLLPFFAGRKRSEE